MDETNRNKDLNTMVGQLYEKVAGKKINAETPDALAEKFNKVDNIVQMGNNMMFFAGVQYQKNFKKEQKP